MKHKGNIIFLKFARKYLGIKERNQIQNEDLKNKTVREVDKLIT